LVFCWSVGMGVHSSILVFCFIGLVSLNLSSSEAGQRGPDSTEVPLRVPVYRPLPVGPGHGFSRMPSQGIHVPMKSGHVTPLYNCLPERPRPSRRAQDSSSGPLSALYSVVSYPFRMLSGSGTGRPGHKQRICPPPICTPMKPPVCGPVCLPSSAGSQPDGLYRAAYRRPPVQ
jgi:hypothetical protein